MAVGVSDPATIEVANSQAPIQAAAPNTQTSAPVEDLAAYLNPEPDEFDLPPRQKKAPESVQEDTSKAPTSTHPATLVDAARDAGLNDRQIAALGTADLFDLVLGVQRKLAAREPEERPRRRQPEPEPAAKVDDDEEVLTYLESEVGADKKLVNLLRTKFKRQAELETALSQRQNLDLQRRRNDNFEAVDDAIDSLGPKFEKLFGKGAITAVGETQKAKRNRLFNSAGIKIDEDSPRAIKSKITQAALELYSDVLEAPETKPTPAATAYAKPNGHRITEEEWDRGTVARPTGTKPVKARGEKAAAAAIRDRMIELGAHAGAADDEFDGLPN